MPALGAYAHVAVTVAKSSSSAKSSVTFFQYTRGGGRGKARVVSGTSRQIRIDREVIPAHIWDGGADRSAKSTDLRSFAFRVAGARTFSTSYGNGA